MKKLILILLALVSIGYSQTFITIPSKIDGQQLSAAEFEQLLDALKDSTRAIKTTHVYTGTLRLAGVNYTAVMIPSVFDDSLASPTSDEIIQDLVGVMTTGNTETNITVAYQDADGTIDFTVTGLLVLADFNDSLALGTKTQAHGVPLDSLVSVGNWKVFYTNGSGTLIELTLGASGTVLKSNGATSAPSWQTDATGAGGSAYSDSVSHDARRVPGDSLITDDEGAARYVLLTIVGDSIDAIFSVAKTISGDWVNTANPWADNEVSNTLSIEDTKIDVDTISAHAKTRITFTDTVRITLPITGISTINLSKISNFQAGGVALRDSMLLSTLPGLLEDAQIAAAAIDGGIAGEIADSSIIGVDIGSNAIGAVHIATGAVGTAEIATDGVSADELNATGVEAELEAVLDLESLQGAVTDGQVPNNVSNDLLPAAGTNPTTDAAGEISVDTDDDALELYSSASRIIPSRQVGNYTILFPDSVRSRTDDVVFAHFPAEIFPFGVTVFYIAISTSATVTDTHVIEEWSDAVGTSQGTVESIALSGVSKTESTSIDDGAIAADAYLNINLDDTPDNVNQLLITVGYYVNSGD